MTPPRVENNGTLLAIDFNEWAAKTYAINFPGVRVECGPVADFISTLPSADIIIGGPPCQPFSDAGKNEGEADDRDCIPDFIAAVAQVMPRQFLMENVRGLLKQRHLPYFYRVLTQLESLGYVVQWRLLDVVDFGVPQFRERVWVWGIRSDVHSAGARHCWPKPTHAWPPPETSVLFGEGSMLLPGVTVGQALSLDGELHRKRGKGMMERSGERRDHPTAEPSPSIQSNFALGGGSGLFFKPRVIGGGTNPHFPGEDRTERDITDEPSTTIAAGHTHNALPAVVEYRWSDKMLEKHPPASPASPAPTVQAKWWKGGAEGLLLEDAPCHTISGSSREPIQDWKGKKYCRRLTPDECGRLQSIPDDFIWPEKISKTNKYKVVGNGWASRMGHVFRQALTAADPASVTTIDLFCGGGLGACGWHGRFWQYIKNEEECAA